ncbi:hypothetical protein VPH35_065692 [Triticum aestivum]
MIFSFINSATPEKYSCLRHCTHHACTQQHARTHTVVNSHTAAHARLHTHTHTYAAVAHTYAHTNRRNIRGTRTQTYHMRAKWSFQVSFRLKMDISVIKGIKFRLLVR